MATLTPAGWQPIEKPSAAFVGSSLQLPGACIHLAGRENVQPNDLSGQRRLVPHQRRPALTSSPWCPKSFSAGFRR